MELSEEKRRIHDRAEMIRHMSDQQLCDLLDKSSDMRAEIEITAAGGDAMPTPAPTDSVCVFIGYLEERLGEKNGIGRGTILQLRRELGNAVAAGVFRLSGG